MTEAPDSDYIDFVFDGPPGPEGPRLIEVEDSQGRSIKAGEWMKRRDGYWALRVATGAQTSRITHAHLDQAR